MKQLSITLSFLLFVMITNAQNTDYTEKETSKFALEMYKKLAAEDNKNMFFSPFSLSIAMGMTYSGANAETEKQIADVFGFSANTKGFHKSLGKVQNDLVNQGSKGVEIAIANQLWVDKQFKFRCSYLRQVKRAYGAPIERMPFRVEPEKCRLEINKWVEGKTNNRIVNLLPKGSITDLTALVLTNAIYFKGQWDNKFLEESTRDGEFTTLDGERVRARMMSIRDKFKVYEGDDLKMIELPYAGKQFSMLVVLPNESISITKFEQSVSLENIDNYIDLLSKSEVYLKLPKFKFESEYELKPVLSNLGMPIAFSNAADFTRMSKKPELKIDEVYHKAFVEVSEEGTEAAAATAVVIVRKSVGVTVEFDVNRPFMFLIRDNASGTIVFMGRVTNPSL
jgi:serpin B